MKACRTCGNWLATGEFLDRIDPATQDEKAQLGYCRRYPPHPETAGTEAGISPAGSGIGCHWPKVASDDWCGEWDPQFS